MVCGSMRGNSNSGPYNQRCLPPIVINIAMTKHEEWGWTSDFGIPLYVLKRAWTEIDIEVIDVAEFTVTVKLSRDRVAHFQGEGHEWFKAELDLYLWEIAGKYKVKIEMVDFAGNELDPPYEEEVDGWFGGVLRMLEALWGFICAVVSAIADAVMKALSFLVDLIIQAIRAVIDPMLETVQQAIKSFQDNLIFAFSDLFEERSKSKAGSDESLAVDALMWLIGTADLMVVIMMIFSTLEVIEEFGSFALAWMHALVAAIAGIVLTILNYILWIGLASTSDKTEVSSEYFHTVADQIDSVYWKTDSFKRTVMSVIWKYFTRQLSTINKPFVEFARVITLTVISMCVMLVSILGDEIGLSDDWRGAISLFGLVILMIATGYFFKNLYRASTKFAIAVVAGTQLATGYSMFLLGMARLM
jgi:hypothetical protein